MIQVFCNFVLLKLVICIKYLLNRNLNNAKIEIKKYIIVVGVGLFAPEALPEVIPAI